MNGKRLGDLSPQHTNGPQPACSSTRTRRPSGRARYPSISSCKAVLRLIHGAESLFAAGSGAGPVVGEGPTPGTRRQFDCKNGFDVFSDVALRAMVPMDTWSSRLALRCCQRLQDAQTLFTHQRSRGHLCDHEAAVESESGERKGGRPLDKFGLTSCSMRRSEIFAISAIAMAK